ncbi:MAG: NUDIX domain-containing protein [Gammaproteobacteria bacterium]|nr:MAG: NUDIX domain-containing protein [Gammaproteobacteria bacterium]
MNYRYELLRRERICEGFLKLDRYRLRHGSFRGGWCPPIERERLEELGAASVLLFDPARDTLVFVEQFRVGLLDQAEPPWTLETVSGFCDKRHESPEEVVRREVREETGCELLDLLRIGSFFVSPGISSEQIHLFCGHVDSRTAEGVHGLAEEGEEIRVVKMTRTEAMNELFGRLNSTSVLMAMQWLALNLDAVRRAWLPAEGG